MATVTSNSAGTQLSGLASGLDWTSIIDNLVTIERAPETLLNTQINTYTNKKSDWTQIGTDLTKLTTDLTNLKDPSFFSNRTATPSDTTLASAQATAGTPNGTYNFEVTQIATAAVQQSAIEGGKALSATSDVSKVVLSSAGFATPITAGNFTVNGNIVTIATTDTLQSVFDKISTATSGAVTGSYDPAKDEISLNSSSPIVLGSSNDTSNFLQVADLFNNGSGAITSTSALGSVNQYAALTSSNLTTTVSDGGGGNGSLIINGVNINYNVKNDSINDVLQRITDSTAGVTATYDSLNNRFSLTNKTLGNIGISLNDVTGNFLAATGLAGTAGGTLLGGTNLQYKLNGGTTLLTSQTNQITSGTSGVTGLTVNALKVGTFSVTVAADTSKISSAISGFVSDYNSLQSFISSKTATTKDANGNTVAGDLTGNLDAEGLANSLRSLVDAVPFSGAVSSLDSLGIQSNGTDNTLALSDTTTLNNALANNLEKVKALFTDSTSGIGTKLDSFISNFNGINGPLNNLTSSLAKEITTNNNTITTLEAKITQDKARITQEFVNYENVASSTSSQKSYLTSFFSSSSSS